MELKVAQRIIQIFFVVYMIALAWATVVFAAGSLESLTIWERLLLIFVIVFNWLLNNSIMNRATHPWCSGMAWINHVGSAIALLFAFEPRTGVMSVRIFVCAYTGLCTLLAFNGVNSKPLVTDTRRDSHHPPPNV